MGIKDEIIIYVNVIELNSLYKVLEVDNTKPIEGNNKKLQENVVYIIVQINNLVD